MLGLCGRGHGLLLVVDCGGRARRRALRVLLQVVCTLLLLHVGGGLLLGRLAKVLVVHVGWCLRLLLKGEQLNWLLLLLHGRVQ